VEKMSDQEGNRDNSYSFDDYILVKNNFNFYRDDEFFQALVKKYVPSGEFEKTDLELRELSDLVTFQFKALADEANRLENRIKCTLIEHYDAYNHRIDKIKRCAETETLEREVTVRMSYIPVVRKSGAVPDFVFCFSNSSLVG